MDEICKRNVNINQLLNKMAHFLYPESFFAWGINSWKNPLEKHPMWDSCIICLFVFHLLSVHVLKTWFIIIIIFYFFYFYDRWYSSSAPAFRALASGLGFIQFWRGRTKERMINKTWLIWQCRMWDLISTWDTNMTFLAILINGLGSDWVQLAI